MANLKTENETFLGMEPDYEEPGKPLVEYVRISLAKIALLWSQKWLLIGPAVLGLLIALGISLLRTPQYVAIALFLPPEMNPTSGLDLLIGMKTGGAMMGGAMGNALSDMLDTRTPGQLYIQEMQTRAVEDKLINRFDLTRTYRAKSREAIRKALEGNTKFDEDRKSGILRIKVTDTDPNRAAALANGYAEELGQLLADVDSDAGHREREYFEAQIKIAQDQLDRSSKALSDFSGKNAALNLPLQSAAMVSSTASLEGRLIAAQTQLNGLLPIYTENNMRVKEARAQVAELQLQLNQMQGKAVSSAKSASAKPEDAATVSGSSKMQQLAGLSSEYMDLYRGAKIDEAMIETLTQQYEIAKLEETRHMAKIRLLDPALPPEHKSFPRKKLMSATGLVIGFFLGAIFVLLTDMWKNTSDDNEWKKLFFPISSKFGVARRAWFLTHRRSG